MKQFDDTDRGVLFKNDRKDSENHPDYRGSINVGGVDYWLSAWIKESAKGKFMSLSVKAKDAQMPAARQPAPANGGASFRDDLGGDDIPFSAEFR